MQSTPSASNTVKLTQDEKPSAHLCTRISIGLFLSKLFCSKLFLSSFSVLLFLLLTSHAHGLKLQNQTATVSLARSGHEKQEDN